MKSKKSNAGRKSTYSKKIAEEICHEIANSSKSLKSILNSNPEFPYKSVFYRWLEDNPELQDLYARAKEEQIKNMADELLEIADNSAFDLKVTDEGREIVDYENINRSRLRVDTRKWILSKLLPRVYGDKIVNEHTGRDGQPIAYANLNESERINRVEEVLNRARVRRDSDSHRSD